MCEIDIIVNIKHDASNTSRVINKLDAEFVANGLGRANNIDIEHNTNELGGAENNTDADLDTNKLGGANKTVDAEHNMGGLNGANKTIDTEHNMSEANNTPNVDKANNEEKEAKIC